MQEICYRILVPEDHDEYRRIRLECLANFPDNFGTTLQEEFTSKVLKLDKAIAGSNEFNFAFGVFNTHQKLVGICGFLTETRHKTKHRGEIVQMYVDPQYSGLGIGKKLLQCVINKAFSNPQIEQIILSAVFENDKATKLYRKAGFVEYGKLQHYFKTETAYTTQLFFVLERLGMS